MTNAPLRSFFQFHEDDWEADGSGFRLEVRCGSEANPQVWKSVTGFLLVENVGVRMVLGPESVTVHSNSRFQGEVRGLLS